MNLELRRRLMGTLRMLPELTTLLIDSVGEQTHLKQFRMDDSNGEEFNLVRKYGVDILRKYLYSPNYYVDVNSETGREYKYPKAGAVAFAKGTSTITWVGYSARKYQYGVARVFINDFFYTNLYEGETLDVSSLEGSKYIILYTNKPEEGLKCRATDSSCYAITKQFMLNMTIPLDQLYIESPAITTNCTAIFNQEFNSMLEIPKKVEFFSVAQQFRSSKLNGGLKIHKNWKGEQSSNLEWYQSFVPTIVYEGSIEDWVKVPFGTSGIDTYANYAPASGQSTDCTRYFNDNKEFIETTIKVPEGVTTIYSGAFCNSQQFTKIESDSLELQKFYDRCFWNCKNLEIPASITANVSHVGYGAFQNVKSIEKVVLTTDAVVGAYCFCGSGLKEIVLGKFPSNLQRPFTDSTLEKITFTTEDEISFDSIAFYNYSGKLVPVKQVYYKGSLSGYLTKIRDAGVSLHNRGLLNTTGSRLFIGINDDEVIDLVIPTDITSIRDGAFRNLSNLRSVDLQNVETIGVRVFTNSSLEGHILELPSTLTSIGNEAFMSTRLKEVHINSEVTYNGRGHFRNISTLEKVYVNVINFAPPSDAFYVSGAPSLYYIGNLKQYIENVVLQEDSRRYFSGRIFINGDQPLKDTDFVSPEGVVEISTRKFKDVPFNSITISKDVTTIGVEAFDLSVDYRIELIDIGENVTSIGNKAFNRAHPKDLKLRWKGSSILPYNTSWSIGTTLQTLTLHVPNGEMQNYRESGYTEGIFPIIIDDL